MGSLIPSLADLPITEIELGPPALQVDSSPAELRLGILNMAVKKSESTLIFLLGR